MGSTANAYMAAARRPGAYCVVACCVLRIACCVFLRSSAPLLRSRSPASAPPPLRSSAPPRQREHQQQRAQVGQSRNRAAHKRQVVVLRQVTADGVDGLEGGRKGYRRAPEPLGKRLRRVRADDQQIERKMAVGVVARLAGKLVGRRRPAERIEGRGPGIERGAQALPGA